MPLGLQGLKAAFKLAATTALRAYAQLVEHPDSASTLAVDRLKSMIQLTHDACLHSLADVEHPLPGTQVRRQTRAGCNGR